MSDWPLWPRNHRQEPQLRAQEDGHVSLNPAFRFTGGAETQRHEGDRNLRLLTLRVNGRLRLTSSKLCASVSPVNSNAISGVSEPTAA
jgi:hypothetical protein